MAEANTTNQEQENKSQQTAALTPVRRAQGMIHTYAKKLLNDERAQMFATQLAVMVRKEPKLALCTEESLATAVIACVHLDLMPNTPEGLAYVIPYKNNRLGRFEAQFQVGYKGMAQLAFRSGTISGINAELVFPEDQFDVDYATREMHHKPDLTIDRTDYSKAIAAYAVATLPNGGRVFDVLSPSEITKVRKTVKARSTDAPWETWQESMVKKTAIKRLTKVLPQSSKDNRLAFAAAWDSWAEAGKLKAVDGEIVEDKVKLPEHSEADKKKVKKDAAKLAEKVSKNADSNTSSPEPSKQSAS